MQICAEKWEGAGHARKRVCMHTEPEGREPLLM